MKYLFIAILLLQFIPQNSYADLAQDKLDVKRESVYLYGKSNYIAKEAYALVNKLEEMLNTVGQTSCADIPNSGDATGSTTFVNNVDWDGPTSVIPFKITYDNATKSSPSNFPNGGQAYEKRILLSFD